MNTEQHFTPKIGGDTSFEDCKATAPQVLGEIAHLLKFLQQEDCKVPCEVKTIFDFSWEDFMTIPKRRIKFGSLKERLKFDIDTTSPTDSLDQDPKINNKKIIPSPSNRMPICSENYKHLKIFCEISRNLLYELHKLEIQKVTALFVDKPDLLIKTMQTYPTLFKPINSKREEKDLSRRRSLSADAALGKAQPPINISSTLQLVSQPPGCCLSFSLSFKGKMVTADSTQSDSNIFETSHWIKGKLKEAMKNVIKDNILSIAKGHTKPMVFQTYTKSTKIPSTGKYSNSRDTKSPEAVKNIQMPKLISTMPDGTIYPSGHLAMCQLRFLIGVSRTYHFLFEDAPSLTCLACFISDNHRFIYYNEPHCSSVSLVMDTLGGVIRDINGSVVHTWNWTAEDPPLRPFEFQINAHLVLRVLSQSSITLIFTCQEDSITVPLHCPSCTGHQSKRLKPTGELRIEELTKREPMYRALVDLKGQFQQNMKRLTKAILAAAGVISHSTMSPPFKHKKVNKSSFHETPNMTIMSLLGPSGTTGQKHPRMTISITPDQEHDQQSPAPTHCPVLLRKWLSGVSPGLECKCFSKVPYVTDLELDMFIKTSEEAPELVLVIGIMSSRRPKDSAILGDILEDLYMERNYQPPSPCLQAMMEPYRLLKYDVDCPLPSGPALLVERNGVTAGMTLMYNRGQLIFGGCTFNGYGCTKKDLQDHIRPMCRDQRDRKFLPDTFKFSYRHLKGTKVRSGKSSAAQNVPVEDNISDKNLFQQSCPPTEREFCVAPMPMDAVAPRCPYIALVHLLDTLDRGYLGFGHKLCTSNPGRTLWDPLI
ncbi:uncharacterized protein C3orf20 homolog [Discoglossus pictus]